MKITDITKDTTYGTYFSFFPKGVSQGTSLLQFNLELTIYFLFMGQKHNHKATTLVSSVSREKLFLYWTIIKVMAWQIDLTNLHLH